MCNYLGVMFNGAPGLHLDMATRVAFNKKEIIEDFSTKRDTIHLPLPESRTVYPEASEFCNLVTDNTVGPQIDPRNDPITLKFLQAKFGDEYDYLKSINAIDISRILRQNYIDVNINNLTNQKKLTF